MMIFDPNSAPVPILLIDDDPIFRESLLILFRQFSNEWTCSVAGSVQEGLELIGNRSFGMAIVDVHLPDGDAADFIRNAGTLPCILCTQDHEEPTFRKMFDDSSVSQNIVGYLVKPLQQGVIWSIRASMQIAKERQMRNLMVAEATAGLEDERRLIAQELHDSLGAILTQLNWIFSAIDQEMRVPDAEAELASRVRTMCTKGKQIVADAYVEASDAVTKLRPEAVNVAGLSAAIRFLLEQWRVAAPTVMFEFSCRADLERVDLRRAGIIYRLLQEGITNAMRHTNPLKILVDIAERDEQLILKIKSNGPVLLEKDTYKLTVLRERTSSLGGILQFSCDAAREETALTITIPL